MDLFPAREEFHRKHLAEISLGHGVRGCRRAFDGEVIVAGHALVFARHDGRRDLAAPLIGDFRVSRHRGDRKNSAHFVGVAYRFRTAQHRHHVCGNDRAFRACGAGVDRVDGRRC